MRWIVAVFAVSSLYACGGGQPAESPAVITAVPATASAAPAPLKTAAPPADPVTFTKKAPAVGDKREEEEKSDLQLQMTVTIPGAPPSTQDLTSHETKRKQVEALAVKGDAVTKVKVTYREVTRVTGEHEGATPISGKTYVVDSAGGKITVNDTTGRHARPDEAREVEKDFKNLGQGDPLVASLPTTPLVPGTRLDSMATAFVEYLERDAAKKGSMKVSNAVVSFREKEGDEGIFDISFTLTMGESPVSMNADLRGTFRLRVSTAQPTKMEMKGPISFVPGKEPDMNVVGSGVMTISVVTK